MKRIITYLLLTVCLLSTSVVKAADGNELFPIPTIPDESMNLTERCNYLIYNYWKECPIKRSFSSLSRLDEAFGQWAGLMPYASADTVHLAIDRYIKAVEKESPKNLVEVGQMARKWFYCDTAQYASEEIYLPFCRAVATNKKVPSAQRAQYQAQLKILESSALGANVPNLTLIAPDGSKIDFKDIIASRIILFFNDPDCLDCTLAKARLSADYNLNEMIAKGLVKFVSIYPGEATDQWRRDAAGYNANWVVGACQDADLYFKLEDLPDIYYLDARHKVLGKNIPVDNILYLVRQLNN